MTTDTVGGVWTYATGLARALGARGAQVLLVSMGPRPSPEQRAAMAGDRGVMLLETDLQLEWQDPQGSDLDRARAVLRETVRQFAPALLHFNGYREAAFGWSEPSVVVAHSCVNSWADACGETDAFAGDAWATYTDNVADGLACADAWVAPTASFRDWLAERYRPASRGHAIWNGVDQSPPCMPKQPAILGAGRVWDMAKNMAILSSVAVGLDWPIRIAGATDVRGGGDSRVGIAHCTMLGALPADQLQREMQQAAIFVSPALYEPFGLSVLEAARAGCALVLADLPGFRELWHGAALFVNPRDATDVRSAVLALRHDAELRQRMQKAAIARSGRYTLRNAVNRYCELYASLLVRGWPQRAPIDIARASA
jgi:glycosyltransferase involved in cell wall biosynthesis